MPWPTLEQLFGGLLSMNGNQRNHGSLSASTNAMEQQQRVMDMAGQSLTKAPEPTKPEQLAIAIDEMNQIIDALQQLRIRLGAPVEAEAPTPDLPPIPGDLLTVLNSGSAVITDRTNECLALISEIRTMIIGPNG